MQATIPTLRVMAISSNRLIALLENAPGAVTSTDLSSGRYACQPSACFLSLIRYPSGNFLRSTNMAALLLFWSRRTAATTFALQQSLLA